MRRQVTDGEKIFIKVISGKRLYPKYKIIFRIEIKWCCENFAWLSKYQICDYTIDVIISF